MATMGDSYATAVRRGWVCKVRVNPRNLAGSVSSEMAGVAPGFI